MAKLVGAALGIVFACATTASAASLTLTGTYRDFCAPDIAGACTQLSDFEARSRASPRAW